LVLADRRVLRRKFKTWRRILDLLNESDKGRLRVTFYDRLLDAEDL